MKKKNWYRDFSLVDDKYIDEAHPDNVIKPKRHKIFTSKSIAIACACFLIVFCSLWLFLPYSTTPPDVSKYSDSEYYELIQKVNALTFVRPKYKNNAEKLWAGIKSISSTKGELAGGDGALSENMTQNSVNSYEEITDNQVEGIIEADRIKRSDKYIFYLDNEVLRVYSIDKENTSEVGSYAIYEEGENHYLHQWEFYLSSDCKTVTVITQYLEKTDNNSIRYVKLISLDVSDPANITKNDEFSITGGYLSSRVTNGTILLLTEFVFDGKNVDFDDETTFLPQIDEGYGSHSIPASGIVSSAVLDSNRYVVVMKLDENTLSIKSSAAYLSYTLNVYVSENHVFLTHDFIDEKKNDDGTYTRNSMTEISCLSYGGDVFETKGTVTVRGYIKDQWSMDEYEGVLRVFTTTESTTRKEQSYGNETILHEIIARQSNASLYCIDLSNFEIVASVIDFAPPNEQVRSVRFDKEAAYVCTSIELSDPVFFFDLSDLNNITYKDTGTIEGFSTSLINIGNGYLLGIGRGDSWNSFKAEVYEETENGVRALCQYELKETYYSTDYKSYYIDRQNQLIGIGVLMDSSYNKYNIESRYILLHFDGYELVELVNVPLAGDSANKRGVYIDGYMYMFGNNDFRVKKVFN
ncbi:MAG: hypothetical protein E7614_04760 [Ruminococcaceae bacterium]|nr:hypothetical protein [Oscillospiraceae bacterium]